MSAELSKINDWVKLAKQAGYKPSKMAALCRCSVKTLERYFSMEFNKTPRKWVRETKCQLAAALALKGYLEKAIVNEVGFTSASQLCHQFKKVFGTSLQAYVLAQIEKGTSA